MQPDCAMWQGQDHPTKKEKTLALLSHYFGILSLEQAPPWTISGKFPTILRSLDHYHWYRLMAGYWPRPSSGTSAAAFAARDNVCWPYLIASVVIIPVIFRHRWGRLHRSTPLPMTNILRPNPTTWTRTGRHQQGWLHKSTPHFSVAIPLLLYRFLVNWWSDSVDYRLHHPLHHLCSRLLPTATRGSPPLATFGNGHSLPVWCSSAWSIVFLSADQFVSTQFYPARVCVHSVHGRVQTVFTCPRQLPDLGNWV